VQPAPARKAGAGIGLALGLGAVVVLMLGAVGVGGWMLLRRTPAPAASPAVDASGSPTTALSEPTPSEPTPAGATTTEVAGQADTGTATSPPAEAAQSVAPPQPPPARSETRNSGATQPAPEGQRETNDTGASARGGGDYSFLDEVPSEGPDGRASGEALAQKYRSGGSSGLSSTRFARRGRFPRNIALGERAAVATLAHILFAQEAFKRTSDRYGSLQELKGAGLLHLDVPFAAGVFQRARYRFQLSAEQGEFKVNATPLGLGGRPFVVDDSGYVTVDQ
jgi:hypothetical protein